MTVAPKFEPLEDRIVLDGADPDVTIATADPSEVIELGEQDVAFTLTFDNGGTDTGYVPFVDLIIPTSGADEQGDGPTFDSAEFLGAPITTTTLVFDENGEVEHPFLVNPDGTAFVVTGADEGDTLVVFELPYGSFSPGNPPVDIDFKLDFSDQADLNALPTLQAFGGFALGCDPLDNPGPNLNDDNPIRAAVASELQLDPQLFTVQKINNVSEGDAATGPSYVYSYDLVINVAPGQTLDDFVLTDNLPPEIVYLGVTSIDGAVGTITSEPTLDGQVQPGDQLVVEFDEVSGTVTVTFDYYISNDPSDSVAPTNDPSSGGPTPVDNDVTGAGTWNPLDEADAEIMVSDSDSDSIQATTLGIQKTAELIDDQNAPGTSPGDTYRFTLDIQVSDYFTFGDLMVQDVLGDGWSYVTGSAAFDKSEESDADLAGIELDGFETILINTPTDGDTQVTWDLSAAMLNEVGQDGLLIGDIAGDGTSSGTQTTVQITYLATVDDSFNDTGSGEQQISQGDRLENDVTVTGNVRDNSDPNTVTLNDVTNTSGVDIQIARGEIESKAVYALNGDTDPPEDVVLAAGDTVTFSIVYKAPLAAFEDFRIEDNLPQLVFDPDVEGVVWNAAAGDPPIAGEATFGAQTSASLLGLVPTVTTDGPNNGVIFDFGDFTEPVRGEATIEILFTSTVQDAIFAPDLLLTNQATAFETNTFGEEINSTAIAQFDYAEPDLSITKGVVATDSTDPDAEIVDGPTGLSGVSVPDSGSPRFTGTVSSDALSTNPVDANIENVDAGDTVTFAIVLENTGKAPNGAFNVTVGDTLPDGFEIPGGGLNLSITDGTGDSVGFTRPDGTAATANDLFTNAGGTGLMLVDDSVEEGALSAFNANSGENVIVITYDLVLTDDVFAGGTADQHGCDYDLYGV
ncbi:MAG: hypothetical protein AB8B51_08440 [Sedimentitalea sp.]